jgi:hypothetical protein
MKASWGVRGAAPTVPRPKPAGSVAPGLVRSERTVVVPAIAVTGDSTFTFVVLEAPDSGAWYGEDPGAPGSSLVELAPGRTVTATPARESALRRAVAVSCATRDSLSTRAAHQFDERFRSRASRAALKLPHPSMGSFAIDLGRAALGEVPPPAAWRRLEGGVRLTSVGLDADPLGWVEEWTSTEDMLVADSMAARLEVACLARWVHDGQARRPASIDDASRRAAIAFLATLDPELAALAGGASTA